MGLVDDRVEYKNPNNESEGYEVLEGKKDQTLVIHRADVLKLQQEARQNGRREGLKKRMKNHPPLTTQENKSVTVE